MLRHTHEVTSSCLHQQFIPILSARLLLALNRSVSLRSSFFRVVSAPTMANSLALLEQFCGSPMKDCMQR